MAVAETAPLEKLLSSLPIEKETRSELLARVEQRMQERGAEAAMEPSEADKERVSALEKRLLELSHELTQRRATLPNWAAQRLEERQRAELAAALASATAPDEADEVSARCEGLNEGVRQCSEALTGVRDAGSKVHSLFTSVSQLTADLRSYRENADHPTATDALIAVREKENPAAINMLRRRLVDSTANKAQRLC